jgi:hypothetical protein
MGLMSTPKTKGVPALAVYIWFSRISVLNAIITSLVGTPTNIFVIICVSFAIPFHVRLQIFSFEIFQELRMRYHYITHVLRTFGKNTLKTILHFLLQVVGPILFAELMST